MTVIAYSSKHRILAADSRLSDADGNIFTNCQKVYRLKKSGALLGLAGDSDDRDVVTLLEKASPRKMPTRQQIAELKTDFDSIVVFPKGYVFTVTCNVQEVGGAVTYQADVIPVREPLVAIGCGAEYAYGAMEAGKNPIEAVRIACKRNSFCALPVQWEKLP